MLISLFFVSLCESLTRVYVAVCMIDFCDFTWFLGFYLIQVNSIEQELLSLIRLHHPNLVHYLAIKYQQEPGKITLCVSGDWVVSRFSWINIFIFILHVHPIMWREDILDLIDLRTEVIKCNIQFGCQNCAWKVWNKHFKIFYNYWGFLFDFRQLLMEYCSGTSLSVSIRRKRPIHVTHIKYYTEEILNALAYLHNKDVVHKNLRVGIMNGLSCIGW